VRIDELFAEVWRRPEDVELRLVLGDALLEAGDPRGELIQLQRRPQVDHERRVMRLLQQHGLTWLGSLRGAVLPLSYELGFLASCVAIDEEAGGRIEWATVHTVELGIDPVDLLFDPVMRALRRVTGVRDEHLEQFLRARRCPRELEAKLPWDRLPELLARFEGMPDLQALALADVCLSRDGSGRLGSLEVHNHFKLEPLLDSLPPDCVTDLVVHGAPLARREALERAARAVQQRLATIRHVDVAEQTR
jgi:uncharacterized protein (TIGR02996 family)